MRVLQFKDNAGLDLRLFYFSDEPQGCPGGQFPCGTEVGVVFEAKSLEPVVVLNDVSKSIFGTSHPCRDAKTWHRSSQVPHAKVGAACSGWLNESKTDETKQVDCDSVCLPTSASDLTKLHCVDSHAVTVQGCDESAECDHQKCIRDQGCDPNSTSCPKFCVDR